MSKYCNVSPIESTYTFLQTGDTWSSSHEGWDTKKKKDGEEGTSRLLPCHECKTSCKNHISTTRIATEEGAIAERGTKLEGLSCSGNALVCKELVPPDKKKLLVLDINGLLADINSDYKHNQYADFRISGKLGSNYYSLIFILQSLGIVMY